MFAGLDHQRAIEQGRRCGGAGRLGEDSRATHKHAHRVENLGIIDQHHVADEGTHMRQRVDAGKWRGEAVGNGVQLCEPDRFAPGKTLPHGIGALGFSVWAHHMFTTGQTVNKYFSLTSTALVVPAGMEYFAVIATLIGGAIVLRTPMLFALGFFLQFLIGGLSGVIVASPPLDCACGSSSICS